jgi:hypothetical protein
VIVRMTVEVYDRARHFKEIASWSPYPIDPDTLGSGLVVPGVCCIFADGIGFTKTALFYACFTNPRLPAITRTRAIRELGDKLIAAVKASGFTVAVTNTKNRTVEHFWREKGLRLNGESTLLGSL